MIIQFGCSDDNSLIKNYENHYVLTTRGDIDM